MNKRITAYTIVTILVILVQICSAQEKRENEKEKKEIVNSIGMKFKLIPAGSFMMGSAKGNEDERLVHKVELFSFFMGVNEVTQAQYKRIMGDNPSVFKGDDLPVENVSWFDAVEFCRKLSESEGVTYRLPTESEWEYAALGGTYDKEYVWGNNDIPVIDGVKQANVPDETYKKVRRDKPDFSGYFNEYDDGYAYTSPVGIYAPNKYGLYDMAGNVFEWCSDYYAYEYLEDSPSFNPKGPKTGTDRCMRGGCFAQSKRFLRVRGRFRNYPGYKSGGVGFRCVRDIDSVK